MITSFIPQFSGSPATSPSTQTPGNNLDPYAAFAELLRQSLGQENRGLSSSEVSPIDRQDLIPNLNERQYQTSENLDELTLDLLSGTEDFNSLGVLVLRNVNMTQEALTYSEPSQLNEQQELVLSPLTENDGLVSNESNVHDTRFKISNSINTDLKRSVSSASINLGKVLNTVSSAKEAASIPPIMKNAPLPSFLTQRVSDPPRIEAEETKSSMMNVVEDFSEAQNSEIEVSIIRGELGLIIQVSTPSMSLRLLKALEQRLTRLVEQSGESVQRIEFNASNNQAINPIYSVLERTNNGSD